MRRGLLLACAVALLWCALICAIHRASPRTRLSAHGFLHVAIAESCQRSPAGSLLDPKAPDDPLFAGEPLPYYFFFHRVALALAARLGIDVASAFELLLLAAAAATVLLGWAVGRRTFRSDAAGLTISYLVFAGAHPQGPLVLLAHWIREGPAFFVDDGSYLWGLVHPYSAALRIGDWYGTLGPLISTYVNLTARPLALAALLAVVLMVDLAAQRTSIVRGVVRWLGLALATTLCTLFNPVVGIAAAGALAVGMAAAASMRRGSADGGEEGLTPRRAFALAVALIAGAALAWPWLRPLTKWFADPEGVARESAGVHATFNLQRVVPIATGGWLIALFAWFGRRRLAGSRRSVALALLVAAGLLSAATAIVALPVGNENSLFHGALVLLAVPAAGVVVPLRASGPARELAARATRRRTLLVHLAFAPIAFCVLAAYVGRPELPIAFTKSGLERLPADGDLARLYAWIRATMPQDAVVVQDPGVEGRTCAGNTSELPALTGRSLFTDYARHYLVAPFRDAPLRAAITAKLVGGEKLDPSEQASLRALGRPILVVTYGGAPETAARLDGRFGPPLFSAGSIRVHRIGSE
jgi:hypothetical protein